MKNFEEIIKRLADYEVKYILIGGYAAIVHGSTMVTNDLDLLIPFEKDNMEKLLAVLGDIHPRYQENKLPLDKTAEELCHFNNLYLNTDIGPIDILGQISGLGNYNELLQHVIEIQLFDKSCLVLDLDTLIESKRIMGRAKDKNVVIELEAIAEKIRNL